MQKSRSFEQTNYKNEPSEFKKREKRNLKNLKREKFTILSLKNYWMSSMAKGDDRGNSQWA